MNGLKPILDRLGLKQSEFAKLLDVSPRTVSLWASADVDLPGPVRAYLRMLQTAEPCVRAAELSRLSGARRVGFEDGVYSLTYSDDETGRGDSAEGRAVAVLKAGRIVGSDAGGGLFEGTYRFDSQRQTNQFHVRLRVPAEANFLAVAETNTIGDIVEVTAEVARAGPVSSTVVHVRGRPLELTLAYLGPVGA